MAKNRFRIITGLIIFALYIGTGALSGLVHPMFYEIMVAAFSVIAVLEVSKALEKKFGKPYNIPLIIATIGCYAAYTVLTYTVKQGGLLGYFGVLVATILTLLVVKLINKNIDKQRLICTYFVLVYPLGFFAFMLALATLQIPKPVNAIGTLLFVSCGTDLFAFFVGSLLKGPKLAPKISPNKTISGAIGGILGGILGATIMFLFARYNILGVEPYSESLGWNIGLIFLFGVPGAVLTQAGDLLASYVKRMCEIKDYGHILPGHGGIMDRVDGTLINAIYVYIFTLITVLFI